MDTQEARHPRPPLGLMVTGQEWVSLSMETVFSPRGYAFLRAITGAQALRRIADSPPDLLLVEKDLRDMTGAEFCAEVRSRALLSPTTPICVISTGPWGRDEKLDTLRAGAWDVYALPMDSEELFLKLDRLVRAKLSADFEREKGLLDPDTGVYNRQGLLRRIAELSAGASRYGRPIGCVIVSSEQSSSASATDRPTQPPATWTAAAARTMAATLRSTGRASDAVGRLSPNEFVIVTPDTDPVGIRGLTERLRQAIEAVPEAAETPLRINFGYYAVPSFGRESIAPTELLIRAADSLRRAGRDADRRGSGPAGAHSQN